MKVMRYFGVAVATLVLAVSSAHAQGGGGGQGGGRGGRQMERLMAGITLSDAQKASVDSIGRAFRAQMPPMQQGTPPDSATRARMTEVRQKQYAAIRTVLTPDQQKAFDKNVQDLRANMNRPRS